MKKKRKYYSFIVVCCTIAFMLGVGLTFAIVNNPLNSKENKNSNTSTNTCGSCSNTGTTIVENGGLSESVQKVYDSVVMVKNIKNNMTSGSGSGVIYKKDVDYGYIITNYHVIENGTGVKILLSSGVEVEGEVLGGDKFMDIAVIRIDSNNVLSVASIGSSASLKLGSLVFVMGTPVSKRYFNSITGGYISGLNRKVTVSVESTDDWVQEVIQVDAAINPGNSGGGLFDVNGDLIGISSMKLVDSQIEGMGFAIKIEDALKHVDVFEKGEAIQRPYLGITYLNVTEKNALSYYGFEIDSSITEGVVVAKVEDNSVAKKAGLQKGDIIIKLNEDTASSSAFLRYLLYKYNVGDDIKVTYLRDGKEYTTNVKLTVKK